MEEYLFIDLKYELCIIFFYEEVTNIVTILCGIVIKCLIFYFR